MYYDVTSAQYIDGYRLQVTFEDGSFGIVDFKKYIEKGGVFSRLGDFDRFKAFQITEDLGLITWDKPPMPCLATRLPYGTMITENAIKQIEAAENVLHDLGFKQCRVRHHDELARIEIDPLDFERILKDDIRSEVINTFLGIGYSYVSLDLSGYVQGSMNRSISDELK